MEPQSNDESSFLPSDAPLDGQWANTSGAANASQQDGTEDDFYRHSAIVTTIYCLACKQQQQNQSTKTLAIWHSSPICGRDDYPLKQS